MQQQPPGRDLPVPDHSVRSNAYRVVGGVLALLHLGLVIFDVFNADGFMRADRADQRITAMERFLAALGDGDRLLAVMVRQGNFFDYGIHALLYGAVGRIGLIAFQIALAIAAALSVVYIVERVFRSGRLALAAGLLYGLLPQSIAFPHQLLSESISNPMIVLGTAAFIRALESPRRLSGWLLSGLCFGVGGIVRPALCLLPILALMLLAIGDRRFALSRSGSAFIAASFVLMLGWCLFMFQQTGRFGLGESGQDLGLNFADSVSKVLLDEGVGPPDGSRPEWLPMRISTAEYFAYMRQYPVGFVNLYSKNVFVMVADSGIGRLYVDLLGFGAEARIRLQDPVLGWRAQLNNHGVLAMLRQGFSVAPGTIIAGVVGALAFALINLGVLAAYVAVVRAGTAIWKRDGGATLAQRWCLAYLLILPLYVVMTSQVVAHAPSRHRSQVEFAWAILACVGWFALRHWRARPDPLRHLLAGTGRNLEERRVSE
jgi:hypothetical protein